MNSDHCARCGTGLDPLDISSLVDVETEFRKNFPNSWDQDGRERVCDDCFNEMAAEQSPEQYEIEQALKDDDDAAD